MAKSKTLKVYAVRQGREGPKIYNTWSECEKNVTGWRGAVHKSFPTREAAQAWIELDISPSNPWSDVAGTQSSFESTPAPQTPPNVPLDLEPFTADFIPVPSSPDWTSHAPQTLKSTVSLSDEQEHILDLVRQRKNIFFTGSAGTGKSVLLREIIAYFGGKVSKRLAITASTGIAAVNIGGTTLHSFGGIGLGTEDADRLLAKVLDNKNSVERWTSTRTLIIDEISMVDGALFDKLELIARRVRQNNQPFGGIQLVFSGDFCQLPPVPERHDNVSVPILFAFEAKSWQRCFNGHSVNAPTVHQLTKVFRQRDQAFVDMLNSMRNAQLDAKTSAQFYKLSRPIVYRDGLEPCELFPLREQVRQANETRLRRLTGPAQPYVAMDTPGHDIRSKRLRPDQTKKLLDRIIAPETVEFKVGAQVMLIKNMVQGRLVNGSLGQVVGFQSLSEARARHTEIAEVDKSKDAESMRRHNQSNGTAQDMQDEEAYAAKLWPVVRFTNGQTLLLTPVEFSVVNAHGTMEARRDQVPLILAWALSIHKSQGQTLERVKVDLGKVFEKGQAYVALSRATTLEGLQVLNFHPSKVMAHPRVLEWQRRLEKSHVTRSTSSIASAVGHQDELDGFASEETTSGRAARHAGRRVIETTQPTPLVLVSDDEPDDFDEFDDEDAMARYYEVALS